MEETAHVKRVRDELRKAGATKFALSKMESKYLPSIIHPEEHILAIAYGKMDYLSAMLVATDRRIIYLNKQPLFTTMDEIAYDVVDGVKYNKAGLFAAITLHTGVGDYTITFIRPQTAQKFVSVIEKSRVEPTDKPPKPVANDGMLPTVSDGVMGTEDKAGTDFLKQHELAVLSTVDRTGTVHGAVVYYHVAADNHIYIITKSETAKARGMFTHNQVALTIFEPGKLQTVQLEGLAEVEQDQEKRNDIYRKIVKMRTYKEGSHLPPVAKITDGAYVVIKITPRNLKYIDYS